MAKGKKAARPECERAITLVQSVQKGDWVTRPHCEAGDMEVLGLDPPLLDWAYDGPEIAGCPRPWRHMWGAGTGKKNPKNPQRRDDWR
jgi:hypothetical protein